MRRDPASWCTLASAALAAAAWSAGAGSPVEAAQGAIVKRLCKPRIEWTSTGASRSEAQRKAIDGWAAAAAGVHGEAFTQWKLAGIARTSCSLTPDGHRCRAAASPCRDLVEGTGPGTAAQR